MHLAGESEGDGVDMVDICFSEHIIIGPWSLAIRDTIHGIIIKGLTI